MTPGEIEASVDPIRALEDSYGERHQAILRHRQPKTGTLVYGRSRKTLAASRGRMIRRAAPALRKVRVRRGPGRDNVSRSLMVGRQTRRGSQECNNGIIARRAATCEDGENIRQELQEDHRAGDGKANSRTYDWLREMSGWTF